MASRRSVLAGVGVLAGSTALAGCGDLPYLSGNEPRFSDWIPGGREHAFGLSAMTPSELAAVDDFDISERHLFRTLSPSDVEFALLQRFPGSVAVFEGNLSPAELETSYEESLRGDGLESIGKHGEYELFESPSPSLAGIRDGTLVIAAEDPFADHREGLERFVDAEADERPRLVDENEDFETLVDAAPDANFWNVSFDPDPDSDAARIGSVTGFELSNDESNAVYARLYGDEADVDEDAVRSMFEDGEEVLEYDVSVDGRLVVVEWVSETYLPLFSP